MVPSIKFVGSIEFEIRTIDLKKKGLTSHDVIINSIFMNTNLPRAYLIVESNFILKGHKRAEIHNREVNREL